jgi:hypothetical protein
MSKVDTNSIKYILAEMDPAEEVEFERRMSSNPDLRIEVESIRRMKSKLNSLPELSPPKDLTESILSVAASQSKKKRGFRSGYFLSAAVVILGLTTGSLIIYNTSDSSVTTSNASATFQSYEDNLTQQDDTRSANLKPWVDRQDILRLSGLESVSNPIMINEAGNSFKKLRPVGKYPDFQPFSRSVQLTGSNR